MIKKLFPFLCILMLSSLTIRPLLSSGFFPMHDDAQVARVIVMAHALKNGQFPVRIVSDLGYNYGYPLFNFYGPLPYYIGAICNIMGIDALIATKIMIGIGVIMGSIAMYVLSSSVFGTFGGILSATLFTYFPYRAIQVYVRGAVGEMWAMSFLPLVLLGLFYIFQKNKRKTGIFVAGFSLAGIILSHTVFGYVITGSIAFLVLGTFLVSLQKDKRTLRSFVTPLVAVCAAALGLSAFFWIPAFAEMSYTNVEKVIGSTADYKDHYVCLSQLWDSPWGFGGSASGCAEDGMSFKLGKLHILTFFASLLLWVLSKEKEKRMSLILMGIGIANGFLFFLMLSVSRVFWRFIPFFSFIQYPWRFLGLIGIGMSLFSGYMLYKKKFLASMLCLCFVGGGIVLMNAKLFAPQYLYERPAESFGDREELRWRASGVSDEYLPKGIAIPEDESGVVTERVSGNEFVRIHKVLETELRGRYEIEASGDRELKLNMAFFPGWRYFINGKEVWPKVVGGEPSVLLSSGNSLLDMRFSDTPVRKIGNGISLITMVGIIMYCIYGKKTIGNHRHTGLQRRIGAV